MGLLELLTGAPAPQATIDPTAQPVMPMPRYARPGGYSYTSGASNPFSPQPGLLGQMFGWGDNPLYQALRPLAQDVGYGLATGTDVASGLSSAAQHAAQQQPYRDQQRQQAAAFNQDSQGRDSAARNIAALGKEFADLATAVQSGAIDPKEGFNAAIERKSKLSAQLKSETDAKINAKFIKDPNLSAMVSEGALDFADALKLQQQGATAGLDDNIKEYQFYANQTLAAGGKPMPFEQWQQQKGGANGHFADSVIPFQDENGNWKPGRAAPDGTIVEAKMPPGWTYDPGYAAGARGDATYDAKARATARAALPGAEQAADIAQKAVDKIRTVGAPGMHEWFSQWGPRGVYVNPSTPMGVFQVYTKQAQGQAFMQARQMLKGGGQITDFEGRKAEDAYSRIDAAMATGDEQSYLDALTDFEDAVQEGLAKLRDAAGGAYSKGGSALTPAAGGSDDLYQKYGLTPGGQ